MRLRLVPIHVVRHLGDFSMPASSTTDTGNMAHLQLQCLITEFINIILLSKGLGYLPRNLGNSLIILCILYDQWRVFQIRLESSFDRYLVMRR